MELAPEKKESNSSPELKLENWTSSKPVPAELKITIDHVKRLRLEQYLEARGYTYPDSSIYNNSVIKSLQNEENFLGKGGKARVYSFESPDGESKRICIKIMKHTKSVYHIASRGNDPLEEFRIQSKLASLNTDELTKFPRPLQLLECKNDFYALVMEELPASNLQNVLLGIDTLPESFDVEKCMHVLYKYVDEMHENGITHNDLEARNVMLDKQTGDPYIIDFGRSARVEYDEQSQQAESLRDSDYNNLERIERELKELIEKSKSNSVV